MKTLKSLTSIVGMAFLVPLIPLQLSANWVLVDDFQDGLGKWAHTVNGGNFGSLELHTDPTDSNNQAFFLSSGGEGQADFNGNFATIELPISIPDDSVGTVYWRYYQAAPDNNFHVMVSSAPLVQHELGHYTSPTSYGIMQTIWRKTDVGGGTGQEVTIRDETQYPRVGTGNTPETFVPFIHINEAWYEFWMVIRNVPGTTGDNYSVYVRGGQFTEPTLLYVEFKSYTSPSVVTGDFYEEAFFRTGTASALITVTIATESGWANSPNQGHLWLLDDLYISPGVNLSSPTGDPTPVTLWKGYVVHANNVVNTGDWMGSVTIVGTDSNWAYSHTLMQWIYVGSSETNGGWVYLMK